MSDTQEETLDGSPYKFLIAGPAVVTLETGSIARLHMKTGAGIPADGVPTQRLVRGTDRESYNYTGTDNIFARKEATDNKEVLVAFKD